MEKGIIAEDDGVGKIMIIKKYREQIQVEVNKYLEDNIKPRKYYYSNFDFFTKVLNLSYNNNDVSSEVKKSINTKGKDFFDNKNIKFEIGSSPRNQIKIININLLFEVNSKKIKNSYDYLTEFILYLILKNRNDISDDISDDLLNNQKNNFLFQYFKLLFKENTGMMLFAGFVKYNQKASGDTSKLVNEDKKDEVEKMSYSLETLKKIDDLYVKNKDKDKDNDNLVFVFPVIDNTKTSLKKVLEYASEVDSEGNITYFRGQSDSLWGLTPSIARDKKLLENEHRMFYEILSLKPNDFRDDDSDYEKLITMQHYGLPTRLLDLTRNPLIALYFACNYNFDNDGAIFVIKEEIDKVLNYEDDRIKCLTQIVKKPHADICKQCPKYDSCDRDKILNKRYIVKGVARNPRINSQCGDFIFVGANKVSKNAEAIKDIQIEKIIIIDKDAKKELLLDLKLMNIHGGIVYPDLVNMIKYIRKEYTLGSIVELDKESQETSTNESNLINEVIDESHSTQPPDIDKLLEDSEEINKVLRDNHIEDNDIELFLNKYNDDVTHRNSRDLLNKILREHDMSLIERNRVLSKIKFQNID